MKSKKKLLVIASLALAGMLMTSCGDDEGGSSSGNSVVQVDGDVYAIRSKGDLPYVSVNQTINLDDYFYVEMEDGSQISTYSIDNTNADLVIEGHTVKPTKIGNYEIMLAVNDKYTYVTVECKSNAQIELIEFFDSMKETGGQNYTLDVGSYDRKTKRWSYENYSIIHNPNYVAALDLEDPGAVDDNGDPNSFVLANLVDGNGYMGAFDENGVPVFENGKLVISNYYIAMPLVLDGAEFDIQTNEITGVETLVGSAAQEQALLNYGLSNFVENYGYEYNSLYVLDFLDEDNDGKKDTIYFDLTIDGVGTNGVAFTDESYANIRMSKVGSTTYAPLETAIQSQAYIPTPIVTTEIGAAFEKVKEAKNYTVTMDFYPSESDGTLMAAADVVASSAYNLVVGGSSPIKEINTITEEGVETTLESNGALIAKTAFWNEGGKAYGGNYQRATDEEAEVNEKQEIADVTDVFTQAEVLQMTANGVTQANISKAIWKKRSVDEANNLVTFTGNIGDNNVEDGQTNGFYEELFNQAVLMGFTDQSGTPIGFGTYLTLDGNVQYNDGGTCSFTTSSRYLGVEVNNATGEIKVRALIYLPFSNIEQNYFVTEYVISNIGTTTNTFAYGAE